MDKITEEHSFEGRRFTVTWHDSNFIPPRKLVTQASGICFTDDGLIVLVTGDGKSWGLPGGHPENGETIEEAFIREVNEEACSIVTSLVYLGTMQEFNEPESPAGPVTYQTRFWARVQLNEFSREYETIGRKLVNPSALILTLNWKPTRIIEAVLEAALDCEQRFKASKRQ